MSTDIATKFCYKCQTEKPLERFSKDNTKRDGRQRACKECQKKTGAAYRAAHPDYFKRKGKERYDRTENPERYAKYREDFIRRAHEYRATEVGAMNTLLNSAKRRAAKKNLEYNLDLEWLQEVWHAQNGKCVVTGIELNTDYDWERDTMYRPFSPSLDRIDPSNGYTKDNVRLVCTAVNLAFNQFGESVFEKVATAYLAQKGWGLVAPTLPESSVV